MKRIAIFASGSGTNAANIIRYFKENQKAITEVVICNNPNAAVINRARDLHTPSLLITREDLAENGKVGRMLERLKIDLVVLAGFLWLIPESLINKFPNRIVNIHPALLPKYGGKNFYGSKVHDAVLKAGEKKSGITIHYVNTQYDEGKIIFQAECDVDPGDTPETLAAKVHELEHKHYPVVIEQLLEKES